MKRSSALFHTGDVTLCSDPCSVLVGLYLVTIFLAQVITINQRQFTDLRSASKVIATSSMEGFGRNHRRQGKAFYFAKLS